MGVQQLENFKRYVEAGKVKSFMNKIHEANRQHWNNQATTWEERLNRDDRWRKCHKKPELAFEGETPTTIREMVGDLRDKQSVYHR